MNDAAFFKSVRTDFGPLNQGQVNGFNVLLKAWTGEPVDHTAYGLATAWHETAATMQPIYEKGPKSYFAKYEPETKIGKALGNKLKGDGYLFRGRGYVQLTGRHNYGFASKKLGKDFVANPDDVMIVENAARIMVLGMTEGWFTGKKLSDFENYRDMRRVINGTDKAALIASYAMKFELALKMAGWGAVEAPEKPVEPPKPVPVPECTPEAEKPPVAVSVPWWKRLFGW